MRIVVVAGTRPEFIKLAPVVQELRRRGGSPTIIATGQHTDLLRGTPFEDGMAPDVDLQRPGTNNPIHYAGLINAILRAKWARGKPDIVIVQGDTASAYAGACAAQELGILVAHVEAGVRSGDTKDPWPEEIFRTNIDHRTKYGYCATSENQDNCFNDLGNNIHKDGWFVQTGNPGIDALYSHTKPVEQSQKVDRVLITLHRRESFGLPMREIVSGIHSAARTYPHLEFVWPLHPNPRVAEALTPQLVNRQQIYIRPDNLLTCDPMATIPFARMLATSRAVITDSGGVQEEAAALGVAAIIARERTDRPESVAIGSAKVVGRSEEGVLQGLQWALNTRCEPSDCFGDGKAAPRVVEHLLA